MRNGNCMKTNKHKVDDLLQCTGSNPAVITIPIYRSAREASVKKKFPQQRSMLSTWINKIKLRLSVLFYANVVIRKAGIPFRRFDIIIFFMSLTLITGCSGSKHVERDSGQTKVPRKDNQVSSFPINGFREDLKKNLSLHPWEKGFLDVTKAPYNAKADGVTDVTAALQKAIDDAYEYNFVVFLPEGTYLVSNQLLLNQQNLRFKNTDGFKLNRRFCHFMLGSTKGKRPVIRLKDRSRVLDNILIKFRNWKESPASTYGAVIRGINIDMGNNPDVSGISMETANLSAIEDVTVYGEDFNAGLADIPAVAASTTNVRIIGGKIGILQDNGRPDPSVNGIYLEGQSQAGIKILNCRGPLTITGFKIISSKNPSEDYRAIYIKNIPPNADRTYLANMNLIDGTIEVKGEHGKAIYNYAQDVVIKNVFIKAGTIIESGEGTSETDVVKGDSQNWTKINEYYFSSGLTNSTVQIGGESLRSRDNENFQIYSLSSEEPVKDYITKHTWKEEIMPSWEDNVVDIITDYGATPGFKNDADNDGAAIQKAIDETTNPAHKNYGKTVFIPRGDFHIDNTVILKKETRLIGAGKTISMIRLSEKAAAANVNTVVKTVNDPEGNIIVSDVAVLGYNNTTLVDIQSGKSIMRDFYAETLDKTDIRVGMLERPYIKFSENAGGNFYNFCMDWIVKIDHDNLHKKWRERRLIAEPGPDYSLIMFENTKNPINAYMFAITHLNSSPMVYIRNSENVNFYSVKFEATKELVRITDSEKIQIIGSFGLSGLDFPEDEGMYVLENSENIYMANLNRRPNADELKDKNWIVNGDERITDDYSLLIYKTSQ
jgi:hypothetical protein